MHAYSVLLRHPKVSDGLRRKTQRHYNPLHSFGPGPQLEGCTRRSLKAFASSAFRRLTFLRPKKLRSSSTSGPRRAQKACRHSKQWPLSARLAELLRARRDRKVTRLPLQANGVRMVFLELAFSRPGTPVAPCQVAGPAHMSRSNEGHGIQTCLLLLSTVHLLLVHPSYHYSVCARAAAETVVAQ